METSKKNQNLAAENETTKTTKHKEQRVSFPRDREKEEKKSRNVSQRAWNYSPFNSSSISKKEEAPASAKKRPTTASHKISTNYGKQSKHQNKSRGKGQHSSSSDSVSQLYKNKAIKDGKIAESSLSFLPTTSETTSTPAEVDVVSAVNEKSSTESTLGSLRSSRSLKSSLSKSREIGKKQHVTISTSLPIENPNQVATSTLTNEVIQRSQVKGHDHRHHHHHHHHQNQNQNQNKNQSQSQSNKAHHKSEAKEKTSRRSTKEVTAEYETEIARLNKAYEEGHVFEIRGTIMSPSVVRAFLKSRGWVEKKHKYRKHFNRPANFIWADKEYHVFWPTVPEGILVNRHPQGSFFHEKKNLVEPIQNIHFVGTEPGTCVSTHPRTYRLYVDEEKEAFIQDYRFVACLSLLKWFAACFDRGGKEGFISRATLPKNPESRPAQSLQLLSFALAQVKNYIRMRNHETIDEDLNSSSNSAGPNKNKSSTKEKEKEKERVLMNWEFFLKQSHQITHKRNRFEISPIEDASDRIKIKYTETKRVLKDVEPFWPHLNSDGMRNMWLFKPGNGTMGRGILVKNSYEDIATSFIDPNTKNTLWLVQKYIETPLLVHNTKFDIRQWFMVTSWNPLVAWIYRKSYLRFSSKVFSLDDLHESVHLTNNSIQRAYSIDPSRNNALPSENMWTDSTFQSYLKAVGKPTVWNDVIYPGMKNCIRAILFSTSDHFKQRPGSFHIMGADFLLSDDFQPWLIEINSRPIFDPSTKVLHKLCPQCIQDAIRVAMDWNFETNPKGNTGDFELLYHGKNDLENSSKQTRENQVKDKVQQSKNLTTSGSGLRGVRVPGLTVRNLGTKPFQKRSGENHQNHHKPPNARKMIKVQSSVTSKTSNSSNSSNDDSAKLLDESLIQIKSTISSLPTKILTSKI